VEIYAKYVSKKKLKLAKTAKLGMKTGISKRSLSRLELEEIEFKYQQKLILNQLKELTSLVKKMARRLAKLEGKLVKKSGSSS